VLPKPFKPGAERLRPPGAPQARRLRLQRHGPGRLLRFVELAVQGETDNGDNLLEIRDEDVVTAFAIEAVALVDHFDFLDRSAAPNEKKATPTQPPA